MLQAADREAEQMAAVSPLRDGDRDGVKFTTAEGRECEVWFNRDGLIGGHITVRENGRTVVDQPLLKPVPVASPQEKTPKVSAAAGKTDRRNLARIDVSLPGGKVQLVDKGEAALWGQPGWFAGGRGGILQFAAGPEWRGGRSRLKVDADGTLKILLRGPGIRGDDGKYRRYFVEFSDFKVNDKSLLAVPAKVWHNAPRSFVLPVKAGEELEISSRFRTLPGGDRR